MKKLILAAFALTTAAGVFAQGTVALANRISGVPGLTTHIWGPSSITPGLSLIGFGSEDTSTRGALGGTTPYAHSGMHMVGQPGGPSASTTLIGLLGVDAPTSAMMPEGSLVPVGQAATFRTQATTPGGIVPITDTLTGNTPVSSAGAFATFELFAWDNSSGLYPTIAQAWSAFETNSPGFIGGHSSPFQVSAIGGGLNNPPFLNNMVDFPSFNLYALGTIPEPASFALVGLGAAALLIFRRRK
jgi:hypothetical protein